MVHAGGEGQGVGVIQGDALGLQLVCQGFQRGLLFLGEVGGLAAEIGFSHAVDFRLDGHHGGQVFQGDLGAVHLYHLVKVFLFTGFQIVAHLVQGHLLAVQGDGSGLQQVAVFVHQAQVPHSGQGGGSFAFAAGECLQLLEQLGVFLGAVALGDVHRGQGLQGQACHQQAGAQQSGQQPFRHPIFHASFPPSQRNELLRCEPHSGGAALWVPPLTIIASFSRPECVV